jgi:serine protease AprX
VFRRTQRRLVGLTAVGAAALCTVAAGHPAAATSAAGGAPVRVIVQGVDEHADASVARAVRTAGGSVVRPLRTLHGVLAQLPPDGLAELRRSPAVREVTPDARVRFSSVDPALGYDAAGDFGSMYEVARLIGADRSWANGWTGKGVDIGLIDTGVSPVPGLTSGNVVNGPDLSFDSQNPALTDLDGYGHGTHLAGIMVGRDAAGTPADYASASRFTGIAPDARLVSIKVGAADGAADVSQVIAAIDWVSQHAKDKGFNIRVLNLSFGTDSAQSYVLDPLAYAAEAAWRRGILVVAAGGNDGTTRTPLSDPALDPYVLAVGGDDPEGTPDPGDDVVPDFANHGTTQRHVDLVAPAVHVIGLRDPQSVIDQAYPSARVGDRFFRGSGTSQAAAIVSAAAALLAQRYPTMTNEQLKRQLMTTAHAFSAPAVFRGAGLVDVDAAEHASANSASTNTSAFGTGKGYLEQARGSAHVSEGGVDLTGEKDIFGTAFKSSTWAPLALSGKAWTGGSWNGSVWTGTAWIGASWTGSTWAGAPWTKTDWAGHSWTGHSWTGHSWTGSSWDGHSWTDNSWTDNSWTGHSWTDASWASAGWQ